MKALLIPALVAALFVAAPAEAGAPLRINVQNASPATITSLYVRITAGTDWGVNRVGKGGLKAGTRQWVLLADGADKCVTDLKLTTDAGATFVRQVNFCHSHNFVYHGD